MESKFTGDLWGLIGVHLLQILLSVVTLGVGVPWAVCMRVKWYTEHTIVDGKRLVFDGKGIQLFGLCFVWLLLAIIPAGIYIFKPELFLEWNEWLWISIVVLGVYSLYVPIKFQKWAVKHTHAEGSNYNHYWQNNAGYQEGMPRGRGMDPYYQNHNYYQRTSNTGIPNNYRPPENY